MYHDPPDEKNPLFSSLAWKIVYKYAPQKFHKGDTVIAGIAGAGIAGIVGFTGAEIGLNLYPSFKDSKLAEQQVQQLIAYVKLHPDQYEGVLTLLQAQPKIYTSAMIEESKNAAPKPDGTKSGLLPSQPPSTTPPSTPPPATPPSSTPSGGDNPIEETSEILASSV
ncbi:hypothetical protein FRB94_006395 [Tulasnella sp. JGI-2019a]|nr:hypothetical protein FRB94_006395 [Tulasnella sp. JGI-2019a]KAG9005065.1 hypothetical protein FRB93_009934 [Tulasnella sp. JGI-2019a]KAG9037905.1 hypothetical protein FRB95_003745 [Tulasnella sp. JGI-2019a]